jgi:hypothetical protein
MVVAVMLANKMARGSWAMLTRSEDYSGPRLIGGGGIAQTSCEEVMKRMGN